MKNGGITIVDSEEEYAVKLSNFFKEKNGIGYDVQVFTDIHSFLHYEENFYTDILLISDVFSKFIPDLKNYGQLFILNGGSMDVSFKDISNIYKYQSASDILKDVMTDLTNNPDISLKVQITTGKPKIYCMYSPIKRCGKTTFSLIASSILATRGRTLYLNFEEFSALSYYTGTDTSYDLSDLLYYFKQNPTLISKKLMSVVNSFCKFDYISPFRCTPDIKSMTGEEWTLFLEILKNYSGYDYIFLDVSESLSDIYSFFTVSDFIIVPILSDTVSNIKVDRFSSFLHKSKDSSITDKIVKIKLPEFTPLSDGKSFFNELLYGDYGNFVRKIILDE